MRQYLIAVGLSLSLPLSGSDLVPSRVMPNAPKSLVSALSKAGDELWAVGERGHFFQWNENLVQESFPARQLLCDLAVQDNQCWVVGHDALIMYRPYPGAPWEQQYFAPELEAPLFSVHFTTKERGMAVGAYGLVLLTEDGGKNWHILNLSPDEPHFFQVKADSENNWYLAGEFGNLIKLSPSGELLVKYDSGISSTFFGIEVLSPDHYLAYGLMGRAILIDGKKVTPIQTPRTTSLFSSLSIQDEVILIGDAGCILVYREGQLIDRSLNVRIPLVDAELIGKVLQIASTKGLIKLNLNEVLH